MHPAVLFGGSVLTLAVAVGTSEAAFQLYSTQKYLESWHLAVGFVAWGAFALGVWLATATGKEPQAASNKLDQLLVPVFWTAYAMTMAGYAIWLLVGVKNGFSLAMLLDLLHGVEQSTADDLKQEMFTTIPGITTSTQFGIAAMLLGTWLYCRGRKWFLWPLLLLLAVAAGRALIYSERLALIELALPAVVVAIRLWLVGRPLGPAWRLAIFCLPLFGLPLLLVLFGAFESFRSWQYYKDDFDSLADFTIWRFFGYYSTAHNNGAMSLALRGPWPFPYTTFAWFWEFPLIKSGPLDYEQLCGVNPEDLHADTLLRYGNVELNNDGGLFTPARDFGWIGYAPFWAVYGFLAGKAYRGFLKGSLAGCMFYPLIMLALLELPRLQYLTATRTFPAVVLFATLLFWLSRREPASARANLSTSPASPGA